MTCAHCAGTLGEPDLTGLNVQESRSRQGNNKVFQMYALETTLTAAQEGVEKRHLHGITYIKG